MQLAVIGNEDFGIGFRLAGVKKIESYEKAGLKQKLELLLDDENIGIIIMKEEDFKKIDSKLKKIAEKKPGKVIVRISSKESSDIRRLMKKSFGVDLWKKK